MVVIMTQFHIMHERSNIQLHKIFGIFINTKPNMSFPHNKTHFRRFVAFNDRLFTYFIDIYTYILQGVETKYPIISKTFYLVDILKKIR